MAAKSKHDKAVAGLKKAKGPIGPAIIHGLGSVDTSPTPRPPIPVNPIKGLQDALKAAEVAAVAKQVAEVSGR